MIEQYIIVFIYGALLGSFLNVCIYRLPLNKSIIKPRSFCPVCEKTIPWYDNIPLVSFIVLKAKCRKCQAPIPARYFIVELISAIAGVGLLFRYSLTPEFFVYWLFVLSLIVIMFIDIEHHEIPDVISLPGIILGFIAFSALKLDSSGTYIGAIINSALGILVGGGSMLLLGILGEIIFKKEALGGGDVKLMAMFGAFLGWKLVILTFFMAPLLGSGLAIVMKYKYKKDVIPYGPFLSIASIVSLLYGEKILEYLFVY